MGGLAMRAPLLAAMFLIVAFATLAMPGSSNFVGEFYILLGVFAGNMAIAIVATAGVVLASVYALRLYITTMHNRTGARVQSRELSLREGLVLVPLVLLVIAIALYPQFALKRSDKTVTSVTVAVSSRAAADVLPGWTPYAPLEEDPVSLLAAAKIAGPHIDWAGLAPLITVFARRAARAHARPGALAHRARDRRAGAVDRHAGAGDRALDRASGASARTSSPARCASTS